MPGHKPIARRITGVVAAGIMITGSLLATSTPAQAYSPDPTATKYHRDTIYCPCSVPDRFDGTYFANDPGGEGLKIELRDRTDWFVGKVEFHPLDEKLWVYDTRNDGDGFYVTVSYYRSDGRYIVLGTFTAPSTSAIVDKSVYDLSMPEGTPVTVRVYDDAARNDWIVTGEARA